MSKDIEIRRLFTPNQLVGIRAGNEEFVAEVQPSDSETGYKLLVTKLEEPGYERDYALLLGAKRVTAYKGYMQQNSSVMCDVLIAADLGEGIELVVVVASDVTVAQLRNFVRLDIVLPVQLTGTQAGTSFYGPPTLCQTLDISAGGLRCLCPILYDIKGEVDIELKTHAGVATAKGIILRCRLVNQKLFEYAILISELDETNKRLIEEFCRQAVERELS